MGTKDTPQPRTAKKTMEGATTTFDNPIENKRINDGVGTVDNDAVDGNNKMRTVALTIQDMDDEAPLPSSPTDFDINDDEVDDKDNNSSTSSNKMPATTTTATSTTTTTTATTTIATQRYQQHLIRLQQCTKDYKESNQELSDYDWYEQRVGMVLEELILDHDDNDVDDDDDGIVVVLIVEYYENVLRNERERCTIRQEIVQHQRQIEEKEQRIQENTTKISKNTQKIVENETKIDEMDREIEQLEQILHLRYLLQELQDEKERMVEEIACTPKPQEQQEEDEPQPKE